MSIINCSRSCSCCQDGCYFTYLEKPDLIRVTDTSLLSEGSHLEFWRLHLGHSHHALYIKDAEEDDLIEVIHGSSGGGTPSVQLGTIGLNQCCSRTLLVDYSHLYPQLDGKEIIKEAREELGTGWKACSYNCEHTARLVYLREAYEKADGGTTENLERREELKQSTQVQCLGFSCMQAFLLFVLKTFWRIALYVLIQFGVKNLEQTGEDEICDPDDEAEQQLAFEIVIGVLLAMIELVFLIIECRCCCGGECCCGPCQCACKTQRCCCCLGGTLFPRKVRMLVLSVARVVCTVGFAILFQNAFGEACDDSQLGWSVLGSFVGALTGTIVGWFFGTWIAFPIEMCCMRAYRPHELEYKHSRGNQVEHGESPL